MKRSLFCVLALATICLFGACGEKEGRYNPKQEIEKVYRSTSLVEQSLDAATGTWSTVSESSTPKVLAETWDWENGKLMKVVYSPEVVPGGKEETLHFSYDGNRVSRIESSTEYMLFTYNGKKMRKAELYDKKVSTTAPFTSYFFTYDGNKISKIDVHTRELGEKHAAQGMLSRWLGELQASMGWKSLPADRQADPGAKAVNVQYVTLTWSGDNIGQMNVKDDFTSMDIVYTYDNKTNPFKHFLYTLNGYTADGLVFANKNNIVKSVTDIKYALYEEGQRIEDTYSYVYQNEWPVECLHETVFMLSEDNDHRSLERETHYYEYDD